MLARKSDALVLVAVVSVCSSLANSQNGPEIPRSLTPDEMREDLVYLRDIWAPMDRSFTDAERVAFESIVSETLGSADTLTPAEFALEVARAVAVSGNGHTNASLYGFVDYLNFLPIRVWWFLDGLYVVEAHPEFADLLGTRITRIGDLSAEDARARLTPFISGTPEHVRFLSPGHLISLESLEHAGVTRSVTEVTLDLEFSSGEVRTVTLRGQPPGNGPPPSGYGIPIPSPLDNPDRWPHVLDDVSNKSPAFLPSVDLSYEWMNDVLYIRSNQIFGSDDVRLDYKLLELVDEAIVPRRPKFVIVDLRLNTGGDLTNTILFAQILPGLLPEDGRVFVLVGNVTFSAALVTAAMLKGNGREKVVLVGETMGDSPQFWAEGRDVPLPNSGVRVAPSSGFHDWSEGCAGVDHCYWAAEIFAREGVSLEPEVVVPYSFQDYVVGRDTVLETALDLAK